jgi:hypothetical protein
LSHFLEPSLTAIGLPKGAIPAVATVLAVTIATLVSMIIGELVPKKLALALPRQVGKIVIPLQLAFTTVFKPFVRLLNSSANLILRAVGIEPKEELSSARTAEELRTLVRRSASEGSLDRDTATLLARTLVFSTHIAADVMTPRPRLAGRRTCRHCRRRARPGAQHRVLALPGVRGGHRRRRRRRARQAGGLRPARTPGAGAGLGAAVRGAARARRR